MRRCEPPRSTLPTATTLQEFCEMASNNQLANTIRRAYRDNTRQELAVAEHFARLRGIGSMIQHFRAGGKP
jgi:hypothetical protein